MDPKATYTSLALVQDDLICATLFNKPEIGGLQAYFGIGESNIALGNVHTFTSTREMFAENNPEESMDSDSDGIPDSAELDIDNDGINEADYNNNGIYDLFDMGNVEEAQECDILSTRPFINAPLLIHAVTKSGRLIINANQLPRNIDLNKIKILDSSNAELPDPIVEHWINRTAKSFALNLKTIPLISGEDYTLIIEEGAFTCGSMGTNPRLLSIPFSTFTIR